MKGNVDLFLNWDPMWSAARMPPEAEAGRVLGEAGEGAPSEEASRPEAKAGTQGALQVHRTAMGVRKLNASLREIAARDSYISKLPLLFRKSFPFPHRCLYQE